MMKTALYIGLAAAVLTTAPMLATANHCSSDMKHKKHGYGYGHPGNHKHYYPTARRPYYPDYPRSYWRHDHQKSRYQPGSRAADSAAAAASDASSSNIIDTAIDAGSFNTLVDAIQTAGLVETLQGAGPFTVFAPSDEAFAKIPEKIRAALIADSDALAELLSYHVIAGEVTAADVAKLNSATTVQGSNITIDTSNGIKVDGANVITADIRASNGIIHVIDAVMIPN